MTTEQGGSMTEDQIKHLEMQAKFYLNSSIRGLAEIERLRAKCDQQEQELQNQAERWRQRGKDQARNHRNWKRVKEMLQHMSSEKTALETELQSVYDSIVEEMDRPAPLEATRDQDGVWRT